MNRQPTVIERIAETKGYQDKLTLPFRIIVHKQKAFMSKLDVVAAGAGFVMSRIEAGDWQNAEADVLDLEKRLDALEDLLVVHHEARKKIRIYAQDIRKKREIEAKEKADQGDVKP